MTDKPNSPSPAPAAEGGEKKPKQRKSQLHEEFQAQKLQFESTGPRIHTENWLYHETHLQSLDPASKTDRVHILHACEKAYFMRDYLKCLELVKIGEEAFGVTEGSEESHKCEFASAGKKTKKSSKVERHVVELLKIKDACLARLGNVVNAPVENNDREVSNTLEGLSILAAPDPPR